MLGFNDDLITVFAVMSIGRLSSFLSYTNQYSKPFNEISNVVSEFENAKASLRRINNFLNIEDDINKGEASIDSIDRIEFKDMSFNYEPSRKLIENFNLEIKKDRKLPSLDQQAQARQHSLIYSCVSMIQTVV
jgi:ABC-type multidrug transport system, ATPase and permease components